MSAAPPPQQLPALQFQSNSSFLLYLQRLRLEKIKAKHKELRKAEDLQLWKMQAPLYAQVPIWITLSLGIGTRDTLFLIYAITLRSTFQWTPYLLSCHYTALRDLSGVSRGEVAPGLADGGFAWLADLSAPDPTLALPLLLGATTYLNVEVSNGAPDGNEICSL